MERKDTDSSEEILVQNEIIKMKKRKILVLGSPGVGKSALIIRFKDDIFLEYYDPTIQSTYRKILPFNNENIELELIDLDGQTEYTIFSSSKFSYGIHGYIMTYSIDNRQSFELIKIIYSKLITLVGKELPKILIGTKNDLGSHRVISTEEGRNLAKELNCSFMECSAKSSLNINKVIYLILLDINKYENNVDLKKLGCHKVYDSFIQNLKTLLKVFNLLICLNLILAFFFIALPFIIKFYLTDTSVHVTICLFFGFWNILFSFVGLYGSCTRKKEYLNYFFISLIISLLMCIFILIYTIFFKNLEDPQVYQKFKTITLSSSICSLIFQICLIFSSFIFKNIIDLEVNTYMAYKV